MSENLPANQPVSGATVTAGSESRIAIVFRTKRNEFIQWFLHNILMGLAGVWLPFLLLLFVGKWRVNEIIEDGSLLLFAITLTSVSHGFYLKEGHARLRSTEVLTYAGLVVTLVLAVGGVTVTYIVSAFKSGKTPLPVDFHFAAWFSIVVVASAILLNFRLFMAEVTGPSPDFVRERLNVQPDAITSQSASAKPAGGEVL